MSKNSKTKQQSTDSEPEPDQNAGISGFRVVLITLTIALVAIAAGFYIKPSLFPENDAHDKPLVGKPIQNVSTEKQISGFRPRKLNALKEIEDMFDHSAEVANWDIYRPTNAPELKSPFSLYENKYFGAAKREFKSEVDSRPAYFWALYGAAISADKVVEMEDTSTLLEEAIEYYETLCNLRHNEMTAIERDAELAACRRLADRLSYRGWHKRALDFLHALSERFPNEKSIKHDIGVLLITIDEHPKAKELFEKLVKDDPTDGLAEAHFGYLVKIVDSDYETAVKHLTNGIRSGKPGVNDGRFYHHLGDALIQMGRREEADKWYEEGYRHGLFLSPIQRSLYSVADLRAKPWWSLGETGHEAELKMIASHWKEIAKEAVDNLDKNTGTYRLEDDDPREFGDLTQFTLFQRGMKVEANCKRAPVTCSLIEQFSDAANCRRGQVKFSVMKFAEYVLPHTGPTNCRLRAHLGLKVPQGTYLVVAKEPKEWREGEVFVLDDSFEHEAWHNGKGDRIVLIVDFWHPDLSEEQKERLKTI